MEQGLRIAGRFAPGVSGNPRGRPRKPATSFRADGYTNRYTGHGTPRDRRSYTGFAPDVTSDLEAMALRRSEFLAKRIIEALPEEAFRRGSSLKIDGPGDTKKLAERVTAAAEGLHVEEKLVEAAQMERQSGGAAIFPVLAGAQGDLARPLDLRAISSVRALHILEPRELQPEQYYEDIRHPKWGRPERYWFTPISVGRGGGANFQLIHESRLVIFPGVRVSREDQWGQHASWGDSVLSPAKQVLADFGLSWGSAATLLHEHGLGVLEIEGLADILAQADGLEQVDKRVAAMMMAKSSLRALIIGGGDKYTRMASSLGGLAEVLNEFKQLIAGAAETPVSILLGMAQSGLRTGDDDTRSWYASAEKIRAKRYKPRHEQVLRFLFRAGDGPTGGDEPEVWSVEYPSLWTPSEKEQAETRKTDMERAKIAIDAGVASADDVAESFYGGDTYSPDIQINWNRRRAQAAIDAERAEDLGAEDLDALGEGEDEEPEDEDDIDELIAAIDEDLAEDEDEEPDEDEPEDDEAADEEEDRADALDGFRADRGGGARGGGGGGAGGKGYNPNRARDGKFAKGARKPSKSERDVARGTKKIASIKNKQARLKASAATLRAKATELRQRAKTGTAKQRERAKAQLEKIKAKQAEVKAKAAALKTERDGHAAAVKAARENVRAERSAAREARQAGRKPTEVASDRGVLHADARQALEHAREGRLNDAMSSVDRVLASRGYPVNPPPNKSVTVSDAGLRMKDPHGREIIADAVRHWDGRIQLSEASGQQLQRYSATTKGRDPEHATRQAQRDYAEAAKRGDMARAQAAHRELYSLRSAAERDAEGVRTLVHEQIHGHGPTTKQAYKGQGAAVEEIATEMAARVVSRDVFRTPMLGMHEGAYSFEIRAAARAVHEVTGIDADASYRVLGRASERYKQRADRLTTPEHVRSAFAEDLARETRSNARDIDLALARNLAAVTGS